MRPMTHLASVSNAGTEGSEGMSGHSERELRILREMEATGTGLYAQKGCLNSQESPEPPLTSNAFGVSVNGYDTDVDFSYCGSQAQKDAQEESKERANHRANRRGKTKYFGGIDYAK